MIDFTLDRSQGLEPLFSVVLSIVKLRENPAIENFDRLFEAQAMLGCIGRIFALVPLEPTV
jgi:hypothetical protein